MRKFKIEVLVTGEDDTVLPEEATWTMESRIEDLLAEAPFWKSGDSLEISATVEEVHE